MILFAALQFGSLAMLGWLTAALLPWLIYRLLRQRPQTTSWAAVQLLLVAVQQQARQVRIQKWLLLAVRTAILALVALAMSEPTWRVNALGGNGDFSGHLIVVVDQSYSMSCQGENGSRLDRAKQHAKQLVENWDSSIFSVISWAKISESVLGHPTAEASQAKEAIDSLEQLHTGASLFEAIRAVSAAINRAEQEWPQVDRHHVVFISDRTSTTWTFNDKAQTSLSALADRASLSLVDVGDNQRSNLAIVGIATDMDVTLRQEEIRLTATLQGFGTQAWSETTVEMKVEGQVVESKTISLPAGGRIDVPFSYRFADEGRYTVQISLLGNDDALPLDDQRWLVVQVQPQLRIACVEGFPKAAADVARALVPKIASGDGDNSIKVEVVQATQIVDLDLPQYDAILLCDIPHLTPVEQTRLANYVRAGGGLAILAGEQTNIAGEFAELLPVVIGQVATSGDYQFDPLNYEHPIVKIFGGQKNSSLLQVRITKFRQFALQVDRESAATVLALNTGAPALVVDQAEAGRIAVMAIPASLATRTPGETPWSSFPVSPSFLPIVRELVAYLAGDALLEQQNCLVGQSANVPWITSRRAEPIIVYGPNSFYLELPVPGREDQGRVVLTGVPFRGVYTFTAASDEFARVAANLDTPESDLRVVEYNSLPQGLSVDSIDGKLKQQLAIGSQSWVQTLLAVAIALLLSESALACWQGRAWQ